MTDSDARIRALAAGDVAEVARILARSFGDDPAYRYLIPGSPDRRYEGLSDFFALNLRRHLPYACTHVLEASDGAVLGTLTMRPPGGIPTTVRSILQSGIVGFGARNGIGAIRRVFALKDVYEGLEEEVTRGAPHWLFHMLAVRRDARGKGRGLELMGGLLARAGGVPALLTTHQESNVKRFQTLGFEVVETRVLRPAGIDQPYTAYCMRHA
jgi:hypothetical protein